jgi:hypothetical protein
VLKKRFQISYEALRRIVKGKWKPSESEAEDRRKRWEKRGDTVWEALADEGHKPPRKWRERGVGGKGEDGVEKWKKGEAFRRKSWWEKEVLGKALGEKGEGKVAP